MSIENLTVINVYEIAADVGKDVEGLIDQYGNESVTNLMPKIIHALELLENLVKIREEQEGRLSTLQEQVKQLKKDVETKGEENIKLTAEIEGKEITKDEDHMLMLQEITRLRKENEQLKLQISETEGQVVIEKEHEQEALKVLVKMKETVDNQRDQIRAKDHELGEKASDIDALQQQVERLVKLNQALHRKNEMLHVHAKELIHQKSRLETQIKVIDKDRADLVQRGDPEETRSPKEEVDGPEDVQTKTEIPPGLEGMIIIDPKDPNRPRFTRDELQRVLVERDELKLKLMSLSENAEEEQQKVKTEKEEVIKTDVNTTEVRTPVSAKPPVKQESSMKKFFTKFWRPLFDAKVDKIDSENFEILNPESDDDQSFNTDRLREAPATQIRGSQDSIRLQPMAAVSSGELQPFDENHFGDRGDFQVRRLVTSKKKNTCDENLNDMDVEAVSQREDGISGCDMSEGDDSDGTDDVKDGQDTERRGGQSQVQDNQGPHENTLREEAQRKGKPQKSSPVETKVRRKIFPY